MAWSMVSTCYFCCCSWNHIHHAVHFRGDSCSVPRRGLEFTSPVHFSDYQFPVSHYAKNEAVVICLAIGYIYFISCIFCPSITSCLVFSLNLWKRSYNSCMTSLFRAYFSFFVIKVYCFRLLSSI